MNSYARDAVYVHLWHPGRPVKIFTDNSVETIVFWNTGMNNDSLDAV